MTVYIYIYIFRLSFFLNTTTGLQKQKKGEKTEKTIRLFQETNSADTYNDI